MATRVGIDLASTESVCVALAAHGDRYLRRAYTDAEIADCSSPTGVDPDSLAARFAAKEAVMKVLRTDGVPWRSIEVVRHPSGWTSVALDGAAAHEAELQGIGEISLSFSHEAGFASAIALAEAAA
jgi:holo-[acyl-carrier protein] synthase